MFIIFSGVSGSGKNTVMNELLKKRKNLFILEQSSATTREKRESDAIYNTYKYMTKDEFEKGISEGEFFEFEEVHGCYYGVLNEALNRVIDNPQNDYMRDIDVKGNIKLRNYLKDKCGVLSIFLDAPDDVIYDRLIKRGESEERARIRLSRGGLEREYKDQFDVCIENLDLNDTVNKICGFLDAHRTGR